MGLTVCQCALVHIVLDGIEQFSNLLTDLLQGNSGLLMGIAANQNSLACLNILRSDLHADRNTAHLRFSEFPSRALVGVIHLHTVSGQHGFDLGRLLQNAFLRLLDRNDHHLNRCDSRWQHEAVVIAVYHDDAADQTGAHAPGGLVYVLQLVLFIRVLDFKGFCKSIAKVMARSGLKRLAVVHQCLDRVGSFCSGEFLLVGLLAADNRHGQDFLTEIGVKI